MFGHLLSQQVVLDNAEKRAKFWCQISACFQKISEVKGEVMKTFSEACRPCLHGVGDPGLVG